MTADPSSSRRWIRLRQDLYEQVQNHVKALLGESSAGFQKYQDEYEKEFQKAWKIADRDDLLKAISEARVVWMGDFHALQQSQKAQLRILKSLPTTRPLLLAVECIEVRHQKFLDRFLAGKLSEREFLKAVEWKRNWGFPWDHYRPLFRWASKHKVPVFGVNLRLQDRGVRGLRERDRFSGQKIVEILNQFPERQLFVIFGDLHLASKHLPAFVEKKFPGEAFVSIFQNSERLYFQLLRKEIEHQVDVVRLSKRQFCLISVPPWVKWQNYLLYLEEQVDPGFDEEADLTDNVAQYVKIISQDLGLEAKTDHFSIHSASDPHVWGKIQSAVAAGDMDGIRSWIEDGRSFYIPSIGLGYLGSASVNSAAQLAMAIVFADFSRQSGMPLRMPEDFTKLIWMEAVQYFGSKLINPKRKTDTLNDIKATLQARNLLDQGKEAWQLALSQKMLELLHLSGARKERELWRPRKRKAYQEAARILGGILGEKLFYAYRKKLLSRASLLGLLRKPLENENFQNIYWEILEVIESFPEPFQSKTEKL